MHRAYPTNSPFQANKKAAESRLDEHVIQLPAV